MAHESTRGTTAAGLPLGIPGLFGLSEEDPSSGKKPDAHVRGLSRDGGLQSLAARVGILAIDTASSEE